MHRRRPPAARPLTAVLSAVVAAVTLGTGPQTSRPAPPPATQPADTDSLTAAIAEAHGAAAWWARSGVECDLVVSMGELTLVEGRLVMEIHGGRSRLDLKSGISLIFDGQRAWVSPARAPIAAARFHVLAWPYFLAAPFKLDDPGATFQTEGIDRFGEKVYKKSRLTFDAGTGDTPDDWYVVYSDLVTNTVQAMGYVTTYGGKKPVPRAITYHDYGIFSGVVLSQRWQFWDWTEESGLGDEPVGEARLTNIRFVEPDPSIFVEPIDSHEDRPPT